MAKQSIAWHEDCLKNAESHYELQLRGLRDAEQRVEKLRSQNEFYRRQIEDAKARGLNVFDAERKAN